MTNWTARLINSIHLQSSNPSKGSKLRLNNVLWKSRVEEFWGGTCLSSYLPAFHEQHCRLTALCYYNSSAWGPPPPAPTILPIPYSISFTSQSPEVRTLVAGLASQYHTARQNHHDWFPVTWVHLTHWPRLRIQPQAPPMQSRTTETETEQRSAPGFHGTICTVRIQHGTQVNADGETEASAKCQMWPVRCILPCCSSGSTAHLPSTPVALAPVAATPAHLQSLSHCFHMSAILLSLLDSQNINCICFTT